jgi:hypothetical protein
MDSDKSEIVETPDEDPRDDSECDAAQNSMERGTDSSDSDTVHPETETEEALADAYDDTPVRQPTVQAFGDESDWPVIQALVDDLKHHGEVHATVEEHDAELEIRRGTALFDYDAGVIRLHTPTKHSNLVIGMNRIVDWYQPYSVWHE